jgi:DNA modification methylase
VLWSFFVSLVHSTGAGTTLLAAKKCNRRFIGFDHSPDYRDVFMRRFESMFPAEVPASLHSTGTVQKETKRHVKRPTTP